MKKKLFAILVCGVMVLGMTGCRKSKQNNSDDIHTFAGTITECEEKTMIVRPNENEEEYKSSDKFRIEYVGGFNSCKIGGKVTITYKGMINESYPAQVGTTNIEINDFDFYLAGNIGEFYIKDQDKDITLKTYLSTAYQTLDDGIKNITDKLELTVTLKDGGTKIYKSKNKDITMIVCRTTKNDKNILIGDYSMEYTEGDCNN